MPLTPGARLGAYDVDALIGVGGMGQVYRATDSRLRRAVAIKVLPAHLSSSPEARARLEREARAVSALSHPHICTLFDVGSGTPQSVEGLTRCVAEVRDRFGERVGLDSIQHVVISHSHIDHFGYVTYFAGHTDAEVYVHELDARVLSNFEERIVLASKDLRVFMERSGLAPEARQELEEMYRVSKHFFKSVELDRTLRDGDTIINGYAVHHVPGHCPGTI